MRYIPISLVIVVLGPLGVKPFTATLMVSLFVEFVAVPVLLYAILRKIDQRAAILGLALYAVGVHTLPPWATTYWILGDWHWAMALPWFMAALYDVTDPANYRRAGVWLGMMALTEVLMAFLAALGIGLGLLVARKWKPFVEIAGASIIAGSPSFIWLFLYIDHWMGHGIRFEDWGGEWTLGLWLLAITTFLGALFISVIFIQWNVYREWTLEKIPTSILSSTVFFTVLVIFTLLVRAWFLKLMVGIMTELIIYITLPILLIGLVDSKLDWETISS